MTESESVALPFGDGPLSYGLLCFVCFAVSTNAIIGHDFKKRKYFFKIFLIFFRMLIADRQECRILQGFPRLF